MSRIKGEKQYFYAAVFGVLFAFGICMGAIFCAYANAESDQSLYNYLESFFKEFSAGTDNWQIAKRAVFMNMKVFALIFISGFFCYGYWLGGTCIVVKGFVMGFTTAAYIKYYGTGGVWLAMCNLPSALIFIPSLVIFAVTAAGFSKNSMKRQKNIWLIYIILSALILVLFCVSAMADGFLTTTLMRIALKKILG